MPHTEQLFVRSKEKSLLLLMVKSSTAFDAKEKNKQMQKGQMTGICLKFNKTEHLIVVEEEMLEMKKKNPSEPCSLCKRFVQCISSQIFCLSII